jgi:hypothetical protein
MLTYGLSQQPVLVGDVPAHECIQCGYLLISAQERDDIESMLRADLPQDYWAIPHYSLSRFRSPQAWMLPEIEDGLVYKWSIKGPEYGDIIEAGTARQTRAKRYNRIAPSVVLR